MDEDAYSKMKVSSLKQILVTVARFICVQFFHFFLKYIILYVFSFQKFLPLLELTYFVIFHKKTLPSHFGLEYFGISGMPRF